jgi:hypothetical protein
MTAGKLKIAVVVGAGSVVEAVGSWMNGGVAGAGNAVGYSFKFG